MFLPHALQIHRDTDGTATETHAAKLLRGKPCDTALVAEVSYTGGDTDTVVVFDVECSVDGSEWVVVDRLTAEDGKEYVVTTEGRETAILPYIRGKTTVIGTAPSAINTVILVGSTGPLTAEAV